MQGIFESQLYLAVSPFLHVPFYTLQANQFLSERVGSLYRGHKTANEIASTYGVHPTQIAQWKKQVLDELPHFFSQRSIKKLVN
jgi:hypothetical protein